VRAPVAALTGTVFLAGTPAVLAASGRGAHATLALLAGSWTPFDAGAVVGGGAVMAVWLAWTWFAVGTVVAVAARLGGRSTRPSVVRAAGAPSVFVAAVWACIVAPAGDARPDAAAAPPAATAPWSAAGAPVALAASVTGAAALIEAVGRARNARLAVADDDAVAVPLSRGASLRLAAALAMVDAGSRPVAVDVSGAMPRAGDWLVAEAGGPADHRAANGDGWATTVVVEASRPMAPTTWRERTQGSATFMVRLLGPVEVESSSGLAVPFPRGRSLELLAWLVTHRDRPTRSAARTAMWDADVRGSTFNNVVSDLRRSLGSVDGRLLLDRSPDDRMRLAPSVVSDAEVLETALVRFRHSPDDGDALRSALACVRDLPFAGAGYLWPDTEGITSSLVLLVVRAADALARSALERGDVDEVYWATGRGLSVLRNHEGLVELRMRAHASRGDSSAVIEEWRSYERVALRDGDLRAGPSRMSALRDQLVG
jgi:hypothetical protein